jgi:hypothetical protein
VSVSIGDGSANKREGRLAMDALTQCLKRLDEKFGIGHATVQIEFDEYYDHEGEQYGGLHGRPSL